MTSRELRRQLVEQLRQDKYIKSEAVAKAFLSVPRERFVPEHVKELGLEGIYKDVALLTKQDARGAPLSSSSQPAIMAAMLEELRLEPGLNVLEIGAGTGYNAALLSKIVGSEGTVTTLDIERDIVRRARSALKEGGYPVGAVLGDGRDGWSANAPFDRIIATASALELPRAWLDQLAEGGFLTIPLRLSDRVFWPQAVVTFIRRGNRLESVSVIPGGFMGIRSAGEVSAPPSTVYVGATTKRHQESFGSVTGPSLDRLSKKALNNLARNLAQETKVLRLPKQVGRFDLQVFITLAANPNNLVSVSRSIVSSDVGLIDVSGGWFLAPSGKGRRCRAIDAVGDLSFAKKAWTEMAKQWSSLGQPRFSDLSISVETNRPRGAWRTSRRSQLWVGFSWSNRHAAK